MEQRAIGRFSAVLLYATAGIRDFLNQTLNLPDEVKQFHCLTDEVHSRRSQCFAARTSQLPVCKCTVRVLHLHLRGVKSDFCDTNRKCWAVRASQSLRRAAVYVHVVSRPGVYAVRALTAGSGAGGCSCRRGGSAAQQITCASQSCHTHSAHTDLFDCGISTYNRVPN